jgi:hypothetical protein
MSGPSLGMRCPLRRIVTHMIVTVVVIQRITTILMTGGEGSIIRIGWGKRFLYTICSLMMLGVMASSFCYLCHFSGARCVWHRDVSLILDFHHEVNVVFWFWGFCTVYELWAAAAHFFRYLHSYSWPVKMGSTMVFETSSVNSPRTPYKNRRTKKTDVSLVCDC